MDSLDFLACLEDFSPIHGDRMQGDDAALLCGIGRLGPHVLAVAIQLSGRTFAEQAEVRSGMMLPMGYRKFLRLMELGTRWKLPLLTLIDTPGAYAHADADRSNISQSIAECLLEMSFYPEPSIAVVMRQGMSGGALALAVADRVLMREHAVFSVIHPKGCASILFRDANQEARVAQALKIHAPELLELGIIDAVLPLEENMPAYLIEELSALKRLCPKERMSKRAARWDGPNVR